MWEWQPYEISAVFLPLSKYWLLRRLSTTALQCRKIHWEVPSYLPLIPHGPDSALFSHVKAGLSPSCPLSAVLEQRSGCLLFSSADDGWGRQVPLETSSEHLNSAVIKISVDML